MDKKRIRENDTQGLKEHASSRNHERKKPRVALPTVKQHSSQNHIRFDDSTDIPNGQSSQPSNQESDSLNTTTIISGESGQNRLHDRDPSSYSDPDSDSDSDSAPEAIATSTAQQTAKKSTAKLSQALTEQRTQEKAKRRERDAQLKAQAKESTRAAHKSTAHEEISKHDGRSEDESVMENTDEDQDSDDIDDIPDLPADILRNAFAAPRLPTPSPPPPPPSSSSMKKKAGGGGHGASLVGDDELRGKKKLDLWKAEDDGPMDRKVGSVNVRVLSKESSVLPPKGAAKEKALRESWLAGRRGRGGTLLVRRKAVNAGFASGR